MILALATTALLSGCGATSKLGDWLRGGDESATSDAVIIGAPDAETYLAELYELASGDTRRQAAIYEDASSAAQLAPGPSSSLRLALVLATPGHANSNPSRAVTMLREVLEQEPLLTSGELSLATVSLLNAERLAAASGEVARLLDASQQAVRNEEESANRRVTAVEAENRRLREQLEEAEEKLEAITSIERTIREQQ
ncbi:MAG: hypothetical protein P8X98_13250 [Woeseiaceae bacterium]